MFIDMNDDQKYYGKKTPDQTRIYTTLQHLIAQEKAYLRQIIHFNDMLTKANILAPVIPRHKRTVSKSSTETHTNILLLLTGLTLTNGTESKIWALRCILIYIFLHLLFPIFSILLCNV